MQIELTVEQTNIILRSLCKEPYVEVYELIDTIRNQCIPQTAEHTEEIDALNTKIEEAE